MEAIEFEKAKKESNKKEEQTNMATKGYKGILQAESIN